MADLAIKDINRAKRDSNIELLRIVLMFMIILFHMVIHGCGVKDMNTDTYVSNPKDILLIALTAVTTAAVNCFVFISGYFGIKFKKKTFISFIVQAVFYATTIYIIFYVVILKGEFSWAELGRNFFPITRETWWFLNAYLGIYILSPFINKGIEYMSKIQLGGIILIFLYLEAGFIFLGHNFYSGFGLNSFTLLTVYLVARYCKLYVKKFPAPLIIYSVCCLIIAAFMYICLKIGQQSSGWRITAYNTPLVILTAAALFYVFKKIKLQNRFINSVASLTFGIYMFHDTFYTGTYLHSIVRDFNNKIDNSLIMFLILISIAAAVFIIGACVEKTRQIICEPIVNLLNCIINNIIKRITTS